MSRFSPRKSYWLCLAFVALMAAASRAGAQGTIPISVTAFAGPVTPDWCPTSYGVTDPRYALYPATAPLSAIVNDPPSAPYPCTLQGPFFGWQIVNGETVNVQYSPDNSAWSQADTDTYTVRIVQPSPQSSTATLYVAFYAGGYWKFPCGVGAEYSDVETGPSPPCDDVWYGINYCMAYAKSVDLTGLTVVSGATQTNVLQNGGPNWAAVWREDLDDDVIIQATTMPNNQDAWAQIQWTGGDGGSTANQRVVSKGASVKTTVTAQIGKTSMSVNIWILWVTITNKITEKTPPNAVQFGNSYDGTENLGAIAYDDGIFGRTAVGKIVAIGLITPAGVHNVVKAGWHFKRDAWSHDFADGAQASIYDTDWVDDTSLSEWQVLTPDANDQIYDDDAPNVFQAKAKDSFEVYNNFQEYVQWESDDLLDLASDYQGWYWEGWWKANGNPDKITLKQIGQGAITLPNTPHYLPP